MGAALEPGTTQQVLDRVFPDETPWEPEGRPPLEPHQEPPEELLNGTAKAWLLEAGRGAGKTEACARYFTRYMRRHPGSRGRIIAPTYGDAVESCVTGPSGLKSIDPDGVTWVPSDPGGSKVKWENGSEAVVLGTHTKREVERLRALGNRDIDWWEEAAANPMLGPARDQAELGLRRGPHPQSILSTTPRGTEDYRKLREEPGLILVTGISMRDNPHNNEAWMEGMESRYQGTRLGAQELRGQLVLDAEGALWTRRMLEACRVEKAPDLVRAAVAIDPAATSSPSADDTGMMVGGVGTDGEGYLIADRTCHLSPEGWAIRAIRAFHEFDLDAIVAEVNNGGEMVERNIRAAEGGEDVPYKAVSASRGKQTRAEPIATLFGTGDGKRPARVHLVGVFPELEDQLCNWVPGEAKSPDRLDALVWLFTHLMLGKTSSWRPL